MGLLRLLERRSGDFFFDPLFSIMGFGCYELFRYRYSLHVWVLLHDLMR